MFAKCSRHRSRLFICLLVVGVTGIPTVGCRAADDLASALKQLPEFREYDRALTKRQAAQNIDDLEKQKETADKKLKQSLGTFLEPMDRTAAAPQEDLKKANHKYNDTVKKLEDEKAKFETDWGVRYSSLEADKTQQSLDEAARKFAMKVRASLNKPATSSNSFRPPIVEPAKMRTTGPTKAAATPAADKSGGAPSPPNLDAPRLDAPRTDDSGGSVPKTDRPKTGNTQPEAKPSEAKPLEALPPAANRETVMPSNSPIVLTGMHSYDLVPPEVPFPFGVLPSVTRILSLEEDWRVDGNSLYSPNGPAVQGSEAAIAVKQFYSPAVFRYPRFLLDGAPVPQDGILIYEGMRVAVYSNGRYTIDFTMDTPAVPVSIKLQFLLASTSLPTQQQLLTLPTIRIPAAGDIRSPQAAVYAVHHEGLSLFARHCLGNVCVINRRGTTRFGFESTYDGIGSSQYAQHH